METNKNQIMLDYLMGCDGIKHLFFQYGEARDGAMQLVTSSVETTTRARYIDGCQPRRLDYSLVWYKSLGFLPVMQNGQATENVADLDDVQSIIDWVNAQQDAHNLPDFGGDYIVESISCLHDVPRLAGIDAANYNPPLARYTFAIRVEYLDLTHCIFR